MFSGCNVLENLIVSKNNLNYRSIDGNLYSKDGKILYRYAPGKAITAFKIPHGVQHINDEAFYGSANLTNIIIPDSVESVGTNAFYNCNNLAYNIENSLQYLGNPANAYLCLVKNNSTASEISIKSGCKLIAPLAFYQNKVGVLTIPSSVKSIPGDAIDYCYYLTEINVASNNPYYMSYEGTLYNKDQSVLVKYATGKSSNVVEPTIVSFTVPTSVTTISKRAFKECLRLTEIILPDGLEFIEDSAFFNCQRLSMGSESDTYIMPNVRKIANNAFGNCSLHNISLPNIEILEPAAFYSCPLSCVTLGNTLKSIGYGAFNVSAKRLNINFLGTCAEWNAVDKTDGWKSVSVTVSCTDGTLDL
jgi:hypothetical protein